MRSNASTRIEAATCADVPAIAALANEIWRTHYPPIIGLEQTEYMLGRMYSPDALRRLIDTPDSNFELLLVDHCLAGYVSYGPSPNAAEFKLDKLYVHQRYHGLGHGSRLIARVEHEACRLGFGAIVLNVHQRNDVAQRAYRRHGFVVRRAFANDFGNGRVMDDFEMVKHLVAG